MLFKNYNQIVENGKTPILKQIRRDILDVFSTAIASVDPYFSVKKVIKDNKIVAGSKVFNLLDFENVYLVGFGKASVGMSQAICDSVKIKQGITITNNTDSIVQDDNVSTYVGTHPIPDQKNIDATDKIISLMKKTKKNDLLIVLVSGGGSALLCKPRIPIKDMQLTTDLLLKSGININEFNTIRKHLSYVKGGQLVSYANCTVVSLIISDIISDPLGFIASGPTFPDSTSFMDCKKIFESYNFYDNLPDSVKKIVSDGIENKIFNNPKNDNSFFEKVHNFIVANNKIACNKAVEKAEELGYKGIILTTSIDGEARDVGKLLVKKVKKYCINSKKIMFISGGETTVTIKGNGKGGRNEEMVLSAVKELEDSDVVFASIGTDGIDGNTDAAGAIADSVSFEKALDRNLDLEKLLDDNNSYEFFRKINDLLLTGLTGTNVMDLQILVKKY
jgi:hydroxypyruvate reductase/glycerate 2-kinase